MLMLAYRKMLTQQTVHKVDNVPFLQAEDEADARLGC